MTDLATPPVRPAAPHKPASPPALRLGRPRWRDTRLMVGLLLVLLSVVLGARLVAAADRTQAWLVARGPLPAGHVLVRADLTTVRAHVDRATGSHYYLGGKADSLVGGQLARAVGQGELVSNDDFVLGQAAPSRMVPLLVHAGRAPTLRAGDHVDVYVLQRSGSEADRAGVNTADTPPAAGGTAGGTEVRVLRDVEFLDDQELVSGDRSLLIRVPVDQAVKAVSASQSERVDVVRVERGAAGEAGGPGPASAPGYGS